MLPIRDINPTRITPVFTFALIGLSSFVFFYFQNQDTEREATEFLYRRAAVSCEITTGSPLTGAEIANQRCATAGERVGAPVFPEKSPWVSLFTSMFLHANLGHLVFNMWFLWIFGNNVEEAFGHLGFLVLYVIGGVVATMAFVLANPTSTAPLVGASGAIAAVLGAYAVLFPTHRVLTLIGWLLLPVPAALLLGIWFIGQFGLGGTNIAWEAHAGGFVFGLVVALIFRRPLLSALRRK